MSRGDGMEEKNFQRYPKWIKDEEHREYVLRVMESILNCKARVVINNERLFMIDWQGKNSVTEYEMHYILDKERGVFTLYGDWGEAVAYFSHRVEVEDVLSYLRTCSCDCFVEKIVAGNPYVINNEYFTERDYEIGERVSKKVYLWVLGFFMACEDAGLVD